MAALSWSIKHVCIHTQGASLHADFADSRNKFRGPSVREVGVISLPPQFHTEAINWSLSQEEQSILTRQHRSSCSIYRSRIIATVELSIRILYCLYSRLKHQMCWCDFLLGLESMRCSTRRRERKWGWDIHGKKEEDLICEKNNTVSTHLGYWVLYFSITWSNWPTTLIQRKIKVILKHQQPCNSVPSSLLQISCDWWSPEVCELTSRAHLGHDGPEAVAVTSRADLLLSAVISVGRRPANEDVIRSVSSAWHKPRRQHDWFDLFPPALKMNDQELHAI